MQLSLQIELATSETFMLFLFLCFCYVFFFLLCSFPQCFLWSKNDVYCKQEYRIQGYINLLPLLPPPPLHRCCPALTATLLLHPSPIQHCCPCPCHCTVPPPQLLLLLHHTSWLLMLHHTSWLLMLLLHCMVGCGRGQSLVVVVVVVIIGRCRSLSMVVVVVVGGRSRWSLLSLPLSLLSRSVIGRSSLVIMVGHGHDCNHHAMCCGHCTPLQPHVSCELSILLKKSKSAYLLRRCCRGAVLGG